MTIKQFIAGINELAENLKAAGVENAEQRATEIIIEMLTKQEEKLHDECCIKSR